jgi:hypothetical protein
MPHFTWLPKRQAVLMQAWRSGSRAGKSMHNNHSDRASMSHSLVRRGCAYAVQMQRGWRRGTSGGGHKTAPDLEAAIVGPGAQQCFCWSTIGFSLHGPAPDCQTAWVEVQSCYPPPELQHHIHHVAAQCQTYTRMCSLTA